MASVVMKIYMPIEYAIMSMLHCCNAYMQPYREDYCQFVILNILAPDMYTSHDNSNIHKDFLSIRRRPLYINEPKAVDTSRWQRAHTVRSVHRNI